MEDRPKALVVDDNEHVLTYLSVCLNRLNFEVFPVQSGAQALNFSQILKPDVMLLDVRMPMIGGLELLRHLRDGSSPTNTPVIFMSEREEDEAVCRAADCFDFIRKPINLTRLNDILMRSYMPGNEPRRNLRAPMSDKVTLFQGERYMQCHAVNLSEGGIYLRRISPLPVDTEVEVELDSAEFGPIRLKGQVIYTMGISGRFYLPPGMAIKFTNMSAGETAQLRKIVTDLLVGDILDEQIMPIITTH